MYKAFVLCLFMIGIIFITASIAKTIGENNTTRVIYKYLDKPDENDININTKDMLVSDIFKDMFTAPSTWIGSTNDQNTSKRELVNQYFATQT